MPRLDRGIQYAAASLLNHDRLGVLGRPVKPGDDSESEARLAVAPLHVSNSDQASAFSRRLPPELCHFASRLRKDEGAGKAGRRLAPEIRALQKMHTGWTTGVAGRPAFPARWF